MKGMEVEEALVVCVEFVINTFDFGLPIVIVNDGCQTILLLLTHIIDVVCQVCCEVTLYHNTELIVGEV
jgi:hypothetical protein